MLLIDMLHPTIVRVNTNIVVPPRGNGSMKKSLLIEQNRFSCSEVFKSYGKITWLFSQFGPYLVFKFI